MTDEKYLAFEHFAVEDWLESSGIIFEPSKKNNNIEPLFLSGFNMDDSNKTPSYT